MTATPLHKNQAGQPSDNGGHFAATARDEAPEGLLRGSATPAADKLAAVDEAERIAHSAVLEAIPEAIRELILSVSPTAATAHFERFDLYGDGDSFGLTNVRDANGNVIVLKSDVRSAVENITAKTDDASGLSDQPAFVRIQKGMGGRVSYRLDLTAEPNR